MKKIILELSIPEYMAGTYKAYFSELGYNPDIITSNSNWVYKTVINSPSKENTSFKLIRHISEDRPIGVATQQLKLFEA